MLILGGFLQEVLNLALQKDCKIVKAFGKGKGEEYTGKTRDIHATLVQV